MSEPAPQLCFVIPCKGRLAHLRESLPAAAAQAHCIVVDYDCPDRSGDWVNASHPGVEVVKVRDQPRFNLAKARNLGAAQATADWIAFLDADVVPSPTFLAAVSGLLRSGVILRPAPTSTDVWGSVICRREDFRRVDGYDEVFTGWGGEDDDFHARLLRAGLKLQTYPATLLRSIPHDDASRVRYYVTKDRDLSHRVNAAYMALKQDLRSLSGEAPSLELRRALHAELKRVLEQSLPAAAEARIELELPHRRMLPGWSARRTLSYAIPPFPTHPPPAAPAQSAINRPPMPFIVGTGRCGSTLLRLMLDGHPELAITPESHFLPRLFELGKNGAGAGEMLTVLADQMRADPPWHLFAEEVTAFASRPDAPSSLAQLLRALYDLYAEHRGKLRCGDKTPDNVDRMAELRTLVPEARFIHLIRDGRDVALSMRGLWWGPQQIAEAAAWWTCKILGARAANLGADAYLEVRYEDLVSEPEAVLRRICAFIELPWDACMLRYRERAAALLAELGEVRAPDGTRVAAERVRALHLRTLDDPDRSRIGVWRTALDAAELRSFELLAGPLLEELGYATGT